MSTGSSERSENERLSSTVCSLCRQRKTKCNRKIPRCGFCVKAGVACQYVERAQRRGLRAGYVSQLEDRLENLERNIQTLQAQRTANHTALQPPVSVASPTRYTLDDLTQHQSSAPISYSQQGSNIDSNSAISDMMSLPYSFFHHLVELWFRETQMWVPILNREYLKTSLEALRTPTDRIDDLELRAVVALTISYSTQAVCLGYNGRRRLSQHLRSQVLVEAMSNPSMSSLRALVIIAILDYGSDDLPSTFSLLAICRRMCENIGVFRQLLNRIQGESPAQVGPPATAVCNGDDAIPLAWCILALDAASTLGISWRDVSAGLVDHLSSVAFISTPDFRDSFRTHVHLAAIGLQPVHEFFSTQARYTNSIENAMATCEEIFRNLMSYVDGQPETSYTLLADGSIDFDICQTFTCVVSHATIIMLYQRFAFHANQGFSELARQRCLTSCAVLINTIRSISDSDAEINNSPVFATMAFVAARFKLVLCRSLGQPREPLFDVLMHGINMLGRRWQYARRIDIVLRAAIIEVDTGSTTSLPIEFWDLRQSHLDISETLKAWVTQHKPSLYVGNLDGPYV